MRGAYPAESPVVSATGKVVEKTKPIKKPMAEEQLPSGNPKNRSGWNIAFGVWLIVAPFVLGYAGVSAAVRNDVSLGIIVFILALIGTFSTDIRWTRIINVIAGVWLLFAPLIGGYATTTAATLNDVILGILVIVFASTSLNLANKFHHMHEMQHHGR